MANAGASMKFKGPHVINVYGIEVRVRVVVRSRVSIRVRVRPKVKFRVRVRLGLELLNILVKVVNFIMFQCGRKTL